MAARLCAPTSALQAYADVRKGIGERLSYIPFATTRWHDFGMGYVNTVVARAAHQFGTSGWGGGVSGGPSQPLQPRFFCKPDFETDLTATGGASARLEFSEKKGADFAR